MNGVGIHIRPRRAWWEVEWKELLHYSDLLWLFVRRDFVSRYKQTVLGPAWMILQPLAMTLVFTVIFGNVAKLPTDGVPPFLFYMCGQLPWFLFSAILMGTGSVLQSNLGLFAKVYFPRVIVPISLAVSALIPFVLQLLTFLGFYFYYVFFSPAGAAVEPTPAMALAPVFALQALCCGLGCGLIFSAMTAVYRDLQHVLGFLIQIAMYATPIIWPVSELPENWRWAAWLNPMAAPVEGMKWAFFGTGSLTLSAAAASWAMSIGLVLLGFYYFQNVERSYVDRA